MLTTINISSSDFNGHAVTTTSTDDSQRYSLRRPKRAAEIPVESIRPPAKRQCALVRRIESKPKLIVARKEELKVEDFVIAHMKTYAAWPAQILSFGKTFVKVYFFGDESTGNVPFENVGFLAENHTLLKFHLRIETKGYVKAVRSFELALKVPGHLSLTNR